MAAPPVSISSNFPKGLRVLLVDQQPSRSHIEAQLMQPDLNYTVTGCESVSEALSYCRSGVSSFDVVLAEARIVAVDETSGRAFIDSLEDTPVILMSEGSTTGDVLRAVKLGAVDWLDKPLSVLKLKNIWQHSVRKMMQRTTFYDTCSEHPTQPARSKLSSGIESPSTPTLGDSVDLDAISAASFGSIKDLTDFSFSSGAEVLRASFDSCDGSEVNLGSALGQPRPPLAVKPSSFGPLVPVPPTSQWPQLQAGCVWGTPVGGPLAPPSMTNAQHGAPHSVPLADAHVAGSASYMSLSSLMDEDTPCPLDMDAPEDGLQLPVDFLSVANVSSNGSGPIGLKLKKSNSLLNMINAALMSGGQ